MTKPTTKPNPNDGKAWDAYVKGLQDLKLGTPIRQMKKAMDPDTLKKARGHAQELAAMQPPVQSVTPGASFFGPGELSPSSKGTRPVGDVGASGKIPATAYEHALQGLDAVMSRSNIVQISPYLGKLDALAEAAGIPRDQVVADVKKYLPEWEVDKGVTLAAKLRDIYVHYGLLDDAATRRLDEIAAPGGAAMKEKLAQKSDATLQALSQAGTDPKGAVPTMAGLGRMVDEAMHLSQYSGKPVEARENVIQVFNDAVMRVSKLHAEKNESDFKNHVSIFIIMDRNSSNGLEGFLEEHGSILSPEAKQQVADVAQWLKARRL